MYINVKEKSNTVLEERDVEGRVKRRGWSRNEDIVKAR